MPDKRLDLADAAELAELLQFLRDWIDSDHEHLDPSLRTFVGSHSYDTHELRDDLDRLNFLLGGNDGEHLFTTINPR
jgi:hypothetical protein